MEKKCFFWLFDKIFLAFSSPLVAEKGKTAVYQKGLKVAFNDTCMVRNKALLLKWRKNADCGNFTRFSNF